MNNNIYQMFFSASFIFSILRITTPILFAALAVLISSRAGIVNIGVEGIMMFSALMGVVGSSLFANAWMGLILAVFVGIILSCGMGLCVLKLKIDITLAGIALNTLGGGGTIFLLYVISGDRGYSSSLISKTLPNISISLLEKIPYIGEIISGHNVLTYLAFFSVFVIYIILYKTSFGIHIRALGSSEKFAYSSGIKINRIYYMVLVISGMLAGMGGAFMSIAYMNGFNTNMVSGRGFIALAAEAMGQSEPMGVMISSLIFGLSMSMSNHIQGTGISYQLVNTIPYITVVIALTIYSIIKLKRDGDVNV